MMKLKTHCFEAPEATGNRLLIMNLNALAGYIITIIGVFSARHLKLITIPLFSVTVLSFSAIVITLICIAYILQKKKISPRHEAVLFSIEFAVYMALSFVGFYYIGNMVAVGLVFALVAVIIEMPNCTLIQSALISAGSLADAAAAGFFRTCYMHEGNHLAANLYWIAAFIPAFLLLLHVAWQIAMHKKRISRDKFELERMNKKLKKSNIRLRKTQEIALKELDLACAVQNAFLPEIPENLIDWEIAIYFKPCFGVSGDFYDVYTSGGDLKGIAAYDVSGHGVSSALLTMIAKPAMSRIFSQMADEPLNRVMSTINNEITSAFLNIDHFLTAILLRFDGSRVEYINAGHPDLILKTADGTTQAIGRHDQHFKGVPFGIDTRDKSYGLATLTAEPGEMILLYTDGITEAVNSSGILFGESRVIESFRTASVSSAKDALDSFMKEFCAFTEIDEVMDDLTIIILRKK